MASLPPNLKQVALFLERLPGIGEKSATRLAFYLLRLPAEDLKQFSETVSTLKERTRRCTMCMNLSEDTLCLVCNDSARNTEKITVVEDVMDLLSFETGNIYDGVYHVLHGRIDPLNHIGPEDIYIDALLKRITAETQEIILGTNPDMEGEATAMYIRNKLLELKESKNLSFKVSRLGYGIPMGGNLEYADYMTLRKAIENRSTY